MAIIRISLVYYRGEAGEPGDPGAQGEPGDVGHFIMEIKGVKGIKGPTGDRGQFHRCINSFVIVIKKLPVSTVCF
jgi:hypothetical protein